MCCMSNKVFSVSLEAPYNTRLRLMLYGPLDPTLCALLLIQQSTPVHVLTTVSAR